MSTWRAAAMAMYGAVENDARPIRSRDEWERALELFNAAAELRSTCMSERQEILSKLERVWDLNPDKSFGEVIEELAFAHSENRGESLIGGVEDSYLLERLDDIILEHLAEILDEHESGECS